MPPHIFTNGGFAPESYGSFRGPGFFRLLFLSGFDLLAAEQKLNGGGFLGVLQGLMGEIVHNLVYNLHQVALIPADGYYLSVPTRFYKMGEAIYSMLINNSGISCRSACRSTAPME